MLRLWQTRGRVGIGGLGAVGAALLAVALALVGAPPSLAFQHAKSAHGADARWPSASVPVVLRSLPAPLDDELGRAALLRAMSTWSRAGCGVDLRLVTADEVPSGPVVEVRAAPPGAWPHGPTLAAHTDLRTDDDRGTVQRALILLSGEVRFDDQDPVEGGRLDLETVLLHELGHALGLAHSFSRAAVMHAGAHPGERQRALHDDDRQGLCAAFGGARGGGG